MSTGEEAKPVVKVAVDWGASRVSFSIREQEGWKPLMVQIGVRGDETDFVSVIPNCAAVDLADKGNILFSHKAVQALKRCPGKYAIFTNLKAALMGIKPGYIGNDRQSHEEMIAAGMKMDLRDLAKRFLLHCFELVAGDRHDGNSRLIVYLNIVENWENRIAQDLLRSVEDVRDRVEVHLLDECFATVYGSLGYSGGVEAASAPTYVAVFDNGYSTMHSGIVRVDGQKVDVIQFRTNPLGAGLINTSIRSYVRDLFQDTSEDGMILEKCIWDMDRFADEHVKPMESEAELLEHNQESLLFTNEQWQKFLHYALDQIKSLHARWIGIMRQFLIKAIELATTEQCTVSLLMCGRGSQSSRFRAEVHTLLKTDEVLREASIGFIPKNRRAWHVLRESNLIDYKKKVIRLCKKGESMLKREKSEESRGKNRTNDCAYGRRFTLTHERGDPPEIDLSVWGTPEDKDDEAVGQINTVIDLLSASVSDMVELGSFQAKLHDVRPPIKKMKKRRNKPETQVYLMTRLTRIQATFYLVYAASGCEMPHFENLAWWDVIENESLRDEYKNHKGREVMFLRLGQVARPELHVTEEFQVHQAQDSSAYVSLEGSDVSTGDLDDLAKG